MCAQKIGIHLPSLRQPFRQALLTAARLGAQGVEIDARNQVRPGEFSQTGLRDLRKMLDDLSLRVAAVSFATRRGYNVQTELDARVEGTKAVMRLAYSLGCSVVVNHVGRVPAEEELALPVQHGLKEGDSQRESPSDALHKTARQEWRILLDVLKDLAQYGDRVGARLAARTGNESADDMARLLAELPEGALAVDLDPGSLAANGFEPLPFVERLGPSILHVHARDGVRDRALGRGTEVPLGRGTVDFPSLLAALEQRNYRGFFTLQRDLADDPIADLERGVSYLKSIAGEL